MRLNPPICRQFRRDNEERSSKKLNMVSIALDCCADSELALKFDSTEVIVPDLFKVRYGFL